MGDFPREFEPLTHAFTLGTRVAHPFCILHIRAPLNASFTATFTCILAHAVSIILATNLLVLLSLFTVLLNRVQAPASTGSSSIHVCRCEQFHLSHRVLCLALVLYLLP